jgi:predicted dehydrogenase
VAVCDVDAERRAAAEADFPGIETYDSVDALLARSSCGLVTIITPHDTHARLALQCLEAGRHVVVEKPMAITTEECSAMMAAAEKRNLLLSAYHNRHWDGCIVQAVKRIRSGAIGGVVRVKAQIAGWQKPRDWWRSSRSVSGGLLYDWGVHLLEYTLQIVDSETVEVWGQMSRGVWSADCAWGEDTVEDEGCVVVRYANGTWSSLMISAIDADPEKYFVHVTGTEGSYAFGPGDWRVTTPGDDDTVSVLRGKCPPPEWWRYYQNVADSLAGEADLIITPEWARRPIHIIDLAYRSDRAGRALPNELAPSAPQPAASTGKVRLS